MADFDNTDRYNDKTLSELKEILRKRNLKVTGKKKDLVERLQFHDKNASKQEPLPEFHMTLPEPQLYKDLHGDHLQNFPNVTKRRLTDFFSSCEKKIDDKIELLYEQRYLRFVRSVKHHEDVFVTAVIWAEMKKSTSYKVDVKFDKNGVVKQTQCECAVGQGPSAHCKHVGCLLFGLTKFCNSGSIITEVTCTQVLQSFHKCKPHKGSPLKAKNLNTARGKKTPILYDPRPKHKRSADKAEETLRNVVLNWQASNATSKWPVLQKYGPANVKALAVDHDYFELTWEDHFLRQEKISVITPDEISEIERLTRGQQACGRWAQERAKRITASNFGVVCKATDRRNIRELLRTLTGSTNVCSKAMAHGKRYESVAVEHFERLSNTATVECGLFVSQSHPMLAASPDRLVDNEILLEVKCPYSACEEIISEETVPYLKMTVDGCLTLKEGHNYYYQIQGQLYCTGRKICKFIVYTFKDFKVIDIPINETFVTEMLNKLESFYKTHFKGAVLEKLMYKSSSS